MATSKGIGWGDADTRQIERQRALADRLLQRSETPLQGQNVSGVYVAPHWTQQLAGALSGVVGDKINSNADTREVEAAQQRRAQLAEALGGFGKTMAGTPAREIAPLTPNDDEGNPNMPAQVDAKPGDPRAAYAQLLSSGLPELQQIGTQGLAQLPQLEAQQAARADDRAFRTAEAQAARDARAAEAQATREARAQELQMRMQDARASQAERLQAQKELREMQIQSQREMRAMAGAMRPERQAQIIQTADGPMQLVGGKAIPIQGPDGAPVRGVKDPNAPMSAKVADAQDVLALLDQATPLIDKATNSYVGAGVDQVARGFGYAPEGAQAAAQLRALEGALISKMPKMSGPQSDKDVLLYKQMAGQIGDPTVPASQKKAAMATIRTINERHASGGGAPGGAGPAATSAPKRIRLDAQGNVIP